MPVDPAIQAAQNEWVRWVAQEQEVWAAEQQRQMMNMAQGPMNQYASALGGGLNQGLLGAIDGGREIRFPTLQGLNPVPAPADPQAVARARTLLIEAIGSEAVARLEAGGGYPIKSTLWPNVIYVVPKTGKVAIVKDGYVMSRSCIDVPGNIPWPDHVLTRIKAIQADETVVFCTGNIS
jgi:hypothetical protein